MPSLSRPFRAGLIIAVWLGAAALVMSGLVHHIQTLPHTPRGWDDAYVYLGAASSLFGHPAQLYDAAHHQVASAGPVRAYLVPPSGVLPFLPLVPVIRAWGINAATAVWSCIDVAALIGALILAARLIGVGWLTLGAALIVIALGQPFHWEVFSAQLNGVVLLLLVLAMRAFPRTRSGLLMGGALAVKPTAFLVLLVPLLQRRPQLTGIAVLALVVTSVVFVPFIGIGTSIFYVVTVLPYMLTYVMHDPANISLPNVLQTWLGGGQVSRHAGFTFSIPHSYAAAILLWCTRIAALAAFVRIAIDRRVGATAAMCLAIASVPLFTATVWPHYLVYALPLALLTLRAPQLWARAGAALALLGMVWPPRADAMWISLVLLYAVAIASLLIQSGWRPALPRLELRPVTTRANG
jgi:Glycosyltransferase family 87